MEDPGGEGEALVGATVGSYHLVELVGIGGMGHVFRAIGEDGQQAALKIVRREIAHENVYRKRFLREAAIAQQIKNPHVVPVFDVGEHQGVPYLVQRFIEGGTLGDKLEREGSLSSETIVTLCRQVADGLDALFAGNVLLDPDGTAYITDFGLAKDLDGSLLTRPGQALGSLDYMSPEQIRGEDLTAATDVYALGCVVYECFTGKTPFSHKPGMRVIMAHIAEAPPDPCAAVPALSPSLGAAIVWALEKEPADRPPTAGAYAARLAEAAA
jgi:serine/threonine protein kinase